MRLFLLFIWIVPTGAAWSIKIRWAATSISAPADVGGWIPFQVWDSPGLFVWAACIKMSLISELRRIFLSPFESFRDAQSSWLTSARRQPTSVARKRTKREISSLSPTLMWRGLSWPRDMQRKPCCQTSAGWGGAEPSGPDQGDRKGDSRKKNSTLYGVMLLLAFLCRACCIWCH